jgi:hypothetical protein
MNAANKFLFRYDADVRQGAAMQFGLYLKNKGVISAEQLVDALEAQMKWMVPIGQLALEEGMMSARDIFMVLQEQKKYPNMHFGDLAIEMGLLTRDDVMRLLMIQADRKRPLAKILVAQEILGKYQMEVELEKYRRWLAESHGQVRARVMRAPRATPAPATALVGAV